MYTDTKNYYADPTFPVCGERSSDRETLSLHVFRALTMGGNDCDRLQVKIQYN